MILTENTLFSSYYFMILIKGTFRFFREQWVSHCFYFSERISHRAPNSPLSRSQSHFYYVISLIWSGLGSPRSASPLVFGKDSLSGNSSARPRSSSSSSPIGLLRASNKVLHDIILILLAVVQWESRFESFYSFCESRPRFPSVFCPAFSPFPRRLPTGPLLSLIPLILFILLIIIDFL